MKRFFLLLTTAIVVLGMSNCSKDKGTTSVAPATTTAAAPHHLEARALYTGWPETFETGTKGAYADGTVTLSTGIWDLNDALIGNLSGDRKNGTKSVRIENTGTVTMNFDVTNGASQVTIAHGVYGTDASSTWQLWYSTNSGSSWTQTGGTTTTSSTTLATATYTMSVSGNVRFQVRKLTGGRLNIDDFSITDNSGSGGGGGGVPGRDDNMALGNPSGATTNVANPNNYLMVKPQYTLSYNNSKGEPNWVSWHLSTAWLGSSDRCNCFTSDATLPSSFFHASTSNYTSTGFDRGHLCPSGDRTYSDTDNARTFLMTNMTPQAPNMNEVTWEAFESYCRSLATAGNELYIIAGWSGQGGSGSNGGTTNTIASGAINVPAYFWKIAVILPVGTNDVSRITTSTRVITVKMPNTQSVNAHTWDYYRTSVDAIETLTGYDFLSNVPVSIQAVIEAAVDNGPTS